MTVQWRGIVAALHFAACTLAGSALAADRNDPLSLQAVVAIAFGAGAGTAKAGMLCLPSGRFRVADFVVSDAEFNAQVSNAFLPGSDEARREVWPTMKGLRIALDRIDASLCARKYGAFGFGDKRSLSGQVAFEFSWTVTGSAATRHEIVRLEVPKSGAKPAEAFLSDALAVLAGRIAASGSGALSR